ncbi:MAG: hypothetical protein IBJ17_17210, partial [Reyranella sp.]|nr:hypothetical protein [Reyranella sp.]
MAASSKKWVLAIIVVALVFPLLKPIFPNFVSDYRPFLFTTRIISPIALPGPNLLTGFTGQ